MRILVTLVLLLAAGCVTMKDKGLTPEILLGLEKSYWGKKHGVVQWDDWARHMKVPVDARPVGVKKTDCKWQRELEYFDCDYDVDWTSEKERSSGTYKRKSQSVGKDENGSWVELIIVT